MPEHAIAMTRKKALASAAHDSTSTFSGRSERSDTKHSGVIVRIQGLSGTTQSFGISKISFSMLPELTFFSRIEQYGHSDSHFSRKSECRVVRQIQYVVVEQFDFPLEDSDGTFLFRIRIEVEKDEIRPNERSDYRNPSTEETQDDGILLDDELLSVFKRYPPFSAEYVGKDVLLEGRDRASAQFHRVTFSWKFEALEL